MPKWRWLQTELQRIVNSLGIRSQSPRHSSLCFLLRQENSSSKCTTVTPSGRNFHLGNPPGQSLRPLWGLLTRVCSSQPKCLSLVRKERAKPSPGADGKVCAVRQQPTSRDVPAALRGRRVCCPRPHTSRRSEGMAAGVPPHPPARDRSTLGSRVLCHLLC